MAVFAGPDETIRVPKVATGPVRVLPRQFAKPQPQRWPWFVLGGVVVVALLVALVVPHLQGHSAERARQASDLLRLLRG